MPYAGFWIRVGAYLIDAILLGIVGAVIGGIFGATGGMTATDPNDVMGATSPLLNLVSIAIGVAYFGGMESSSWQATLGKKACGLIVTDTNGNRISLGKAIGRYFAKILSALILLIGFIMVAFTDKKQGLHDMLAGTLVLKGQPGSHGTAGVFD
ncbi:MAG: RDD family protein [Erythrobacter sp.]|nr:MAG: RDD family protein [Erythrobacter sp.]